MDAKITGKIISDKRKAMGLNQIQLGERLNVSNRTISKWENGDGYPDITLLPDIAKCLDVTIDELLTGEKPAPEIIIEKEDSDKPLNNFMVCYIISLFFSIFSGLLGAITEIYCIWAFPILFYTHWEIMFAAVSLFSLVAGVLVFAVGIIRLHLTYSKREILGISGKKAILLFGISCVFPLSFLARIIDYSRFGVFMPYVISVMVIAIAAVIIMAYKRINNYEKKD
ncbi:MAG: helix-turn-helix domain-containing protein [Clostridium sp.]|nr:helix-turn-helix domain-containing protein [Clostridium sp.]